MPKRTPRKTKVKKKAHRKTHSSQNRLLSPNAAINKSKKAYWMAYKELQNKADKAWLKLRSDIHRKADLEVLLKDRNELALILGECDYITRECTSLESQSKKW